MRLRNDPSHYSRTVRHWLEAFQRHRDEIDELVGKPRAGEFERFLKSGIKGYDLGVFNLLRITLRRVDLGD